MIICFLGCVAFYFKFFSLYMAALHRSIKMKYKKQKQKQIFYIKIKKILSLNVVYNGMSLMSNSLNDKQINCTMRLDIEHSFNR